MSSAASTDGLLTRAVGAEELGAFFRAMGPAFGSDTSDDEVAHASLTAEPERTLAVFDGAELVATAGAFTFDLGVPGGRAPAAGVTYVGVRPTHRRRGILSRLMRRQLDDIHAKGEPIAVLWASEAAIYGRFGYGIASQLLRVEVDRVDATLRSDLPSAGDVTLHLTPPTAAAEAIEALERALAGSRPGVFARDRRWVQTLLHDSESGRRGMSALQCLVAERSGDAVGYALYRTKAETLRPSMLPDGEVLVQAQASLDPAAGVALTRTLLAMDLMRRVRWWNLPVDTALPHLLVDPRHARTTVVDALHLRVVDVPAALKARRYVAPVDVVLDVVDEQCPWNHGSWHLSGDRDSATCEPTKAPAQLRMPVEALGAAYLGGTRLTALAAAGRIRCDDADALLRTSIAMGSDAAPWCPVVF